MTVYYPIEDEFVKVVVSSMRRDYFTAKFLFDEEPENLYPWDNYGQMDNDISYSFKTREPLDKTSKESKR